MHLNELRNCQRLLTRSGKAPKRIIIDFRFESEAEASPLYRHVAMSASGPDRALSLGIWCEAPGHL